MLEVPSLLIHVWQRTALPDDSSAWTRNITDPAGHRLGFVRFTGDANASWFAWMRRSRLDVFETEDASHLLTLARSWGVLRAWDLHDAEDRHVGTIHPRMLMTGERERLAFLDFESSDQGRILDTSGQMLAKYGRGRGTCLELTFTPRPMPNPFLGMLILGSVLTLDPAP